VGHDASQIMDERCDEHLGIPFRGMSAISFLRFLNFLNHLTCGRL
jgi:hypothetical protein